MHHIAKVRTTDRWIIFNPGVGLKRTKPNGRACGERIALLSLFSFAVFNVFSYQTFASEEDYCGPG